MSLSGLSVAFLDALAPFGDALDNPVELEMLLAELGHSVAISASLTSLEAVRSSVASLFEAGDALARANPIDVAALLDICKEVVDLVTALDGLAEQLAAETTTDPAIWRDVAAQLPGYLLASFVDDEQPVLASVLRLCGVLVDVPVAERTRPSLDWSALAPLCSDPAGHLLELYDWHGEFAHVELIERLAEIGLALGLGIRLIRVPLDWTEDPWSTEHPQIESARVLELLLGSGFLANAGYVEAGLRLGPLAKGDGIAGLRIDNVTRGRIGGAWSLAPTVRAQLSAELDGSGVLALHLQPGAPVRLATMPPAGSFHGEILVDPGSPWRLLELLGTFVEVGGVRLALGARVVDEEPELYVQLRLEGPGGGLRIGFDGGGVDSFVGQLVGGSTQAEIDVGLEWSSRTGLTLSGSAEFEALIPLNLVVGPLRLEAARVQLGAEAQQTRASATITGGVELGPLAITVEDVGLAFVLEPGSPSGNFGELEGRLELVPPRGAGLVVDAAGVVTGGGFLERDDEAGEYAGMLELAMAGVGLTATGLLTTQLPGGVPGWSLFFSLAATFTGVALGFGFTLNGVGGLIGINRGLDAKALGEGIRSGALDSILFPEDPVADAPRILRDIEAIFPIAVGQYVFGPVAKIGWGVPTLLELDVGVVLQLPEPLTVSLLGSLAAALPSKDAAIVELHVDVAGTLDLSEGTLRVDASLRDSRVLSLELTGDMAVRASLRDAPSFLIAFGGFHPEFAPPAEFPKLQRLGVALDTGDKLRITLGGYLALTSNTLQFGAEFTLWAKAVGFTAEGGASFDALIQFKPFGFVIGMEVWVAISAGNTELLGVLLAGTLRGPNPWKVVGEATFKLLGVKKSLEIEASFGSKADEPAKQTVDVAALLIEELGIDSAWTALAPAGDGGAGVVVQDTSESDLEVHPSGRVEVRQRLVPLATRIDHYGNAKLDGEREFELGAPRIGAVAMTEVEVVEDWFAAAQYFELDDDEKLSAPSFEQMPAGLRLGDDTLVGGPQVAYTYDYELVIRDPSVRRAEREHTKRIVNAVSEALDRALALGDTLAARRGAGLPRSTSKPGIVAVASTQFVASDPLTGARSPATATPSSYHVAREQLRSRDDASTHLLIPAYELELLA